MQQRTWCPYCPQREDVTEDKIRRLRERLVPGFDATGRLQIQEVRLAPASGRVLWVFQVDYEPTGVFPGVSGCVSLSTGEETGTQHGQVK